jgi:hypothetical protein
LRYCVLYKNGGVYLDTKYSCINNFKFIYLTNHEYFCKDIDESGGGIYNAFIVCKAQNNIMLQAINQVVQNVQNRFYGNHSLEPTGPLMLKNFFLANAIKALYFKLKFTSKGLFILYKNFQILEFDKNYRSQQQKIQEHWSHYWNNKTMYLHERPMQYKIEAFVKTYNASRLCKVMTNVVVSRYNTTPPFVTNLNKYNTNLIIYDAKPMQNNETKVNEASIYLKYIIDNYDSLSDFTFFIYDNEYSWCHSGSIEECFLKAITSHNLFYNINQHYSKTKSTIKETEYLNDWYTRFVSPYMQFTDLLSKDWLIDHKGAAQFLVHKNLITQLPIEFYSNLYNWIQNCQKPQLAGQFLELTWKLFGVISTN